MGKEKIIGTENEHASAAPLDTPGDTGEVAKALEDLQQSYSRKLPQKIWLIKDLWQKLIHVDWNEEAFRSLHRLIHSLAGSGRTFGFDELGELAKKFDRYLNSLHTRNRLPDEHDRQQISTLIEQLARLAQRKQGPPSCNDASFNTNASAVRDSLIYIVDDDEDLARYLSTLLSAAGFSVLTFPDPQLARDSIGENTPDLVIMDIMFPDSGVRGFDLVEEIRRCAGRRMPVIFLSGRTDLSGRLSAIRAGGDAYFKKPIDFDALVAKIDELISASHEEKYRLLVVDDDKELSEHYALTLKKAGMICETLNNPITIMQCIEQFQPHAVIMDLHMPQYNGLELTSVLRQDEDLYALPIIFVTSEAGEDYKTQALGLGVNDYLAKPVADDALIEAVYKQVRCARRLRSKINSLTKNNLGTGLVNREYFLSRLESAVSYSREQGAYFSVLDIMIDHYEIVKEKIGRAWIDEANKQIALRISTLLSGSDIATVGADGVFMVLTENRSADELLQLGKRISDNIAESKVQLGDQQISVTCSIGVVELDGSANSLRELLVQAQAASLYAANGGGEKVALQPTPQADDTQQSASLHQEVLDNMHKRSFKLVYQPIISLDDSGSERYETLLRMISAEERIILPAQFMPILEQERLLADVDRWVIENAINSLSGDSHARINSDLFVKISAATLQSKLLLPLISNALSGGRIIGDGRVVFSMGEKDVVTHSKDVLTFAQGVKTLRCGFAIDHFGTTDASVRLLEEIPVDYVKLRDTVLNDFMVNDEKRKQVVELIAQAKNRGVEVIACSIENPASISALWNMGARYFQGYFIKEPDSGLKYDFSDASVQ